MSNTNEFHLLFPEATAKNEDTDGRLSVDVIERDRELVVRSAIAGVKPENLEVFVHDGMLTIRGRRHEESLSDDGANYLVRECHWGSFSRSIILPAPVDAAAVSSTLANGVLTVTLPKAVRSAR